MIKSIKNHTSQNILIKLHVLLWVLFGLFSVYDTLWSCTEWGVLPYLFLVWVFLFVAFYLAYGLFAPKFFIEKKYIKGTLGLFLTLITVNFIYTEIQYIIPLDICNKRAGIDESIDRSYYWFNIIINLKTTSVLILFAFVLFYLEFAKSEELKQKTAHIEYLKNQISPHYLLNALNDLMYTAIDSPLQVKDEIEELSDWLVFSLYKIEKSEVPLIEEINHVKLYFKKLDGYIENDRKVEVFKGTNKLPEAVSQLNIPPLILFNLAENAVKFSRIIHKKDAFINFETIIENDFLVFRLKNSVDHQFKETKKENGIGLSNVLKRLNLFYGNRFDYSILQNEKQFEIVLRLPL